MGNAIKDWSKFSNDDLLQLLKEKQKELCHKVTIKDLGNKNGLPSPSYFYKRFNTWSLNKILEMANLATDNIQKIPKDKAIQNLQQYYKKLGRVPTRKDFEENNWKPYYQYYHRNFNSFENACFEAGIIKQLSPSKQKRIDDSIEELKRIAYELNKCPTVEEYETYKRKGLSRRVLEKNTVMKWNDICTKYIPQYKLNIDRDITEQDIKKDIDYVVNKTHKTPTYKEYLKYSVNGYSLNAFYTAIGLTYNKTLIKFGYEPRGVSTKIRDEEELLDDFYKLFKEIKRVPYTRDIDECIYCASYSTYKKYFDSIENVCLLLNIDYNEYYRNSGAGLICYDLNGKLCKSIPERNISNFLILNNIQFEDEPRYSEIFDNDGRKFDWKVNLDNQIYYIEYFGMYDNNPRGHIGKKYHDKTHKKIKDLYKAGFIDRCIFIFPYDIDNKKLINIFKKYTDKKLVEYIPDDLEQITFYSQFSSDDLFNEVLKYCENDDFIKAYELLNKCSGLYSEILLRYGSYYDFTQAFGVNYKYRNFYWTKDKAFKIMNYMIIKYGKILPRDEIANINDDFDNIASAYRKYGYSNLKLEYFKKHYENIPELEQQWLMNVYLKKGSGCKQLDKKASYKAYEILQKIS